MSARRVALGLAVALALGVAPACFYTGGRGSIGPQLDEAVVARIQPGVSTKAEVLALLGPPNEYKRPELEAVIRDDTARISGALAAARRAQDVLTWQRDELDFDGIWLLLWNRVGVDTDSDLLVVFFDEADVVRDVAMRRSRL